MSNPLKQDRPKQQTPNEMVGRLMALVRGQFCGDLDGKEWGQHSHFIRRNVILWPAHFVCNKKGFTLPADRYEQIMRSIFAEMKGHMTAAPIRFWPGYLMKVVQDHWKHNWEDYYYEAKAARSMAENALLSLGKLPVRADSTVEALAGAHQVLAQKASRKRSAAQSEPKLPGF